MEEDVVFEARSGCICNRAAQAIVYTLMPDALASSEFRKVRLGQPRIPPEAKVLAILLYYYIRELRLHFALTSCSRLGQ